MNSLCQLFGRLFFSVTKFGKIFGNLWIVSVLSKY